MPFVLPPRILAIATAGRLFATARRVPALPVCREVPVLITRCRVTRAAPCLCRSRAASERHLSPLWSASARRIYTSPEGIEFFETHIRPVLVERCYECHSAKAKVLQGGLRLDSAERIRTGGDSGPVIVPQQA